MLIAILFGVLARCAADEQIFTVVVLPEATPKPVFKPLEDLPYYRLDQSDVKILARLLWSSPLRDESSKIKLIWCVLNRVTDDTGRFGDSIQECVNKTEFTFFDKHARVSDRNKAIVERELTRWMAYKDGYGIGYHPSTKGVFCRFTGEYNRKIELMSDPYGKALE